MDERGTSGDLAEVYVRCECGQERSMAQAAVLRNWALGPCDGARPWLGPYTHEVCGEPSRLLIRTASNAYFPQTMRVISLPDHNEAVSGAVDLGDEHDSCKIGHNAFQADFSIRGRPVARLRRRCPV
jgi:hypothetical protein